MLGYKKILPNRPGDSSAYMPAKVYNQLVDVAQGLDFDRSGVATEPLRSADIVYIKNNSGSAVGMYNVLGLGDPIITPAANLTEFKTRIAFTGHMPAAAADIGKFAITLEPIAAGAIGRGVIAGCSPVQLSVDPLDLKDGAEVADGQIGCLDNVAGGSATVLWVENNGNAAQWAIVRLGGASGSAAAPLVIAARWITQALPSFSNTAGVLTGSGAMGSVYCDGVSPNVGDVFLYALEGSLSDEYRPYTLTQASPWVATPIASGAWQYVASAQVWVGPEGTNNKNTLWQLTQSNIIVPGTTALKFSRLYQEDRWVKRLASAGAGWDTTSSTSATLNSTTTFTVGSGLLLTAGDTVFMDAGSGNNQLATVVSYSGTTLVVGSFAAVNDPSATDPYASWAITCVQVQGYYPGTVYFQDKSTDVPCWIQDANSNTPNVGIFYRASRNFDKQLDGIWRGFYETWVSADLEARVVCSGTSLTVTNGPVL
jgi:hypothetical protein